MKATQAVSPRATFLRVSEKSSSFPHHASRDLVPFLSAGRSRLAQYRRFYPSYLGENQTIRLPIIQRWAVQVMMFVPDSANGARQTRCLLPRGGRGILVSRILHQRMLPERQSIDDEDDEP